MKRNGYDASQPPSRWLYSLILHTLHGLTRILLRSRVIKNAEIADIKGPIIVLGNHPSYLDPVFMAASLWPRPIHFLTSATFFRKPLIRHILQRVRAIPKVQFRTDTQALKHMLRVIAAGEVLGIYPEGQRSPDGAAQPIDEAIGKLVYRSACTVVVVKTYGAYLSWPRWSTSWIRRGRVEASSQILFRPEDFKLLDAAAVQKIITEAISFNEYDWQRERNIRFRSRAPAMSLHHLCHACPACDRDLVIEASGKTLRCRACGMTAEMDACGFLHRIDSEGIVPESPLAWHQWQIGRFNDQTVEVSQPGCLAVVEENQAELKDQRRGTIILTAEELVFQPDDHQTPVHFPIYNRAGFSADFGHHFELVLADRHYRLIPDNGQSVIMFADRIRVRQLSRPEQGEESGLT